MNARVTSVQDPWEDVLFEEQSQEEDEDEEESASPPPYSPSVLSPDGRSSQGQSSGVGPSTGDPASAGSQTWRYSFVPFDDSVELQPDSQAPNPSANSDEGRPHPEAQNVGRASSGTLSSRDTKRASQLLSIIPENESDPVPAYRIPPAPAPPAIHRRPSEDGAALRPAASTSFRRSESALSKASRKLSNRISSVTSARHVRGPSSVAKARSYGVLEEGEWSDISSARQTPVPHRGSDGGYEAVQASEEDDEPFEAVGMDLSSWEGPIGLRNLTPRTPPGQDSLQHTLTTEYDKLEARGTLTKGLGSGMVGASLVIDQSKNAATAFGADSGATFQSAISGITRGMTVRDVGRREARERNKMVVINGVYLRPPFCRRRDPDEN